MLPLRVAGSVVHPSLAAAVALIALGACGPDAGDDASALGGRYETLRRVTAFAVTPGPTRTPAVIVIVPTATDTVPAPPTAAPSRAPKPTRTPRPSAVADTSPAGERARLSGDAGLPAAPTLSAGKASAQGAAPAVASRTPTRTPKPTRTPRPVLPTATRAPTEDTSLLAQLRRGGLVVYLRHARTDWSQNDRELEWVPEMLADRSLLDDCDRQRLLSDDGRADARAIGEAIAGQSIPVGQVLTSGWCRTRETAEIALGRGERAGDKLFDTGYLDAGSEERRRYAGALRDLLSSPPDGGTNRFLVGHGPQIDDAARVVLQESEAVIVRPEGGSFKVLRRVKPGDWSSLGH